MPDARNIAHDKKVNQEKRHKGEDIGKGADETPKPGRKPHQQHHARDEVALPDAPSITSQEST